MAKSNPAASAATDPTTGDPSPPVEVQPPGEPIDPPTLLGPPDTGERLPPDEVPAATPIGEAPRVPVTGTLADLKDLDPVIVKNHGTRDWIGTDYAPVGGGGVPAGDTGRLTKKKAMEMVAAYGSTGMGDGRGPFSIESERPE